MARTVKQQKAAPLATEMEAARDRMAAIASVAGRFASFRPAREVLTRVRGVRTIFPSVDLATRVGAWPVERVGLVHGESNEGKSEFCLGLGRSFLEAGHFFHFVDAEYTTPETWLRQQGLPLDHPGFTASRPRTYEETVDGVREWAETIGGAVAKGELPPETSGLCVIDSIGKLAPKELLKKIMKEQAEGEDKPATGARQKPKRGIDGMGGRAAQYKAALNNQWMNELVPLMAHTGCTIVVITREIEDPDAGMFDEGFKLTGGRGIFYDSSLVVRIVREAQIWRGEGAQRQTLGERHRVEIRKTKIGRKEQRVPRAWFHSSNGLLVPAGFDVWRDHLDTASNLGVVELEKNTYVFGRKRLGVGEHNAVLALYKSEGLFAELRRAVRVAIEERVRDEPGMVEPPSSAPAGEAAP